MGLAVASGFVLEPPCVVISKILTLLTVDVTEPLTVVSFLQEVTAVLAIEDVQEI